MPEGSHGDSGPATLATACPACGGSQLTRIGQLPDRHWFAGNYLERALAGGSLFRCDNCRLKFRSPIYPLDVYARLYDSGLTDNWQNETTRCDWDRILAFTERHLKSDARVLDFGCNTGGLLARLDPRYKKYGIEVNAAAAAIASARSGARIWSSNDEIPDRLQFDAILLVDVVEHVANPMALLVTLTGLLAKDGMILITTGDACNPLWEEQGANWWYCHYPEHIAFISEPWLRYFSRAAGLSLLHCEIFSYGTLTRARRILDRNLMGIYRRAPELYTRLMELASVALRRRGDPPIPGAGLSKDHLFAVLARGAAEPSNLLDAHTVGEIEP